MAEAILVIKLGAFGDLLAIEGALRDIRKHHQESKLYFLTTPSYKKIMEKCPWVDKVLIDRRKPRWRIDELLKLKGLIESYNFNMIYDLQNSYRTDFYFKYLFSNLNWSGTAKKAKFHIERNGYKNLLERLLTQLKETGITPTHTIKPNLEWMCNNNNNLLNTNGVEKDYIVLLFGSSKNNSDKRWPYFKELAEKLISIGKSVVCVPGPDELEEAALIKGRTILKDNKPIDFFDMAYILNNASFVIGNDSGPSYLAAFLNCTGIIIIGHHKTNMPVFLKHTNFDCLKSDDLKKININMILEKIDI